MSTNGMPLYKLPLPTNVENEEMFLKFIKPFTWEGELKIDGGWGPKNLVQDLVSDDPVTGFKVPFLINPINDMDFNGLEGKAGTNFTSKESNRRYHVAFPGEQWKLLYNFINAVKNFDEVTEQVYILNSYFSTNLPEEGTLIYQLHITISKDNTTISIEKGKWVPTFEKSLLVARW
jgi:hypothetical protein